MYEIFFVNLSSYFGGGNKCSKVPWIIKMQGLEETINEMGFVTCNIGYGKGFWETSISISGVCVEIRLRYNFLSYRWEE